MLGTGSATNHPIAIEAESTGANRAAYATVLSAREKNHPSIHVSLRRADSLHPQKGRRTLDVYRLSLAQQHYHQVVLPVSTPTILLTNFTGPGFFPRLMCEGVTTRFVWPKLKFQRPLFELVTEVMSIQRCLSINCPTNRLAAKRVFYEWGKRQQAAFDQLKTFLMTPPILHIADPDRPYELVTNASDIAVGAVLLQSFGEGLQPIAYDSRKLQGAERNYPVRNKEMLVIVNAFKTWHYYNHDVQQYVALCPTGQLMKSSRQKPTGLQQPLESPTKLWTNVSIDFVTGLSAGASQNDVVFVVVDGLKKMAHFAPCRTTITAEQTTKLFISTAVRLHVILKVIIIDRGPRFTSNFWTKIWEHYGTRLHLSTAHHPQTDSQTELTNQTMEQLIRTICTDLTQWEVRV
ncbi:hypothetical protein CLOP_g9139 [Closterium sp. NIES-67]|nr:hypothetical protein CLOP_g19859 [Closterium sp. NIES-67]GJP78873.1 hypothetical protein CLOP_g9139 [Closterium sp. NIES-67]